MVARGTFRSGFRTLAAATAAVSTPRYENRHNAIAPPMADTVLSPLMFHGWKLPVLMNNNPTVDMNTSGTNFNTDVHTCTAPMFFTPVRLIAAGIHRPTSASRIEINFTLSSLTNSST